MEESDVSATATVIVCNALKSVVPQVDSYTIPVLVDVSDIFYFFSSGEAKGESEAPGRRGGPFFLENTRRGSPRGGGG